MFCSKCGSPLAPGASFCTKCGAKVDQVPTNASAGDATAGAAAGNAPVNVNGEFHQFRQLEFIEAAKIAIKGAFVIEGRATRAEYWWWLLASIILTIPFAMGWGIFSALEMHVPAIIFALLNAILMFFVAGIGWSTSIRRMHDLDRSGWWMLIVLTIVGIFVVIYWMFKVGTPGPNRFGPHPTVQTPSKKRSVGLIIAMVIYALAIFCVDMATLFPNMFQAEEEAIAVEAPAAEEEATEPFYPMGGSDEADPMAQAEAAVGAMEEYTGDAGPGTGNLYNAGNSDSGMDAAIESCVETMTQAYRIEMGEDALVTAGQLDEFRTMCGG